MGNKCKPLTLCLRIQKPAVHSALTEGTLLVMGSIMELPPGQSKEAGHQDKGVQEYCLLSMHGWWMITLS